MKLKNLLFGVMVPALLCVVLSVPARAGAITLEATGTFGPLMSGIDPLKLNGGNFTVTGTINQNSAPTSATADSATYTIPGTLDITVGDLDFGDLFGTMTLTAPSSGPDIVAFDFTVSELGFVPIVTATLSLPAGTLNGTGLQDYSVDVSEPDSMFTFQLPAGSSLLTGTLGITGVASAFGETSPSGVPEPGTLALLAGGLLAVIIVRRRPSLCPIPSRDR
jgi:hypothetical protein